MAEAAARHMGTALAHHHTVGTATAAAVPLLPRSQKQELELVVVGVARAQRLRKAVSGEWMLTKTCRTTRCVSDA